MLVLSSEIVDWNKTPEVPSLSQDRYDKQKTDRYFHIKLQAPWPTWDLACTSHVLQSMTLKLWDWFHKPNGNIGIIL